MDYLYHYLSLCTIICGLDSVQKPPRIELLIFEGTNNYIMVEAVVQY